MTHIRTFYICVLALLMSALAVQPLQAQQTQDALYIFRNDGKFNAFFYDDIERMEYSRYDTLGVKHSDYVTQEIYALDSIFRIPISAIDSVAFVTPETVYKSDIIKVDKSIVNYVIASDSVSWILLNNSTPQSLIPKAGDKILITATSKLLPDGFGGRVTSVVNSAAGTTVTTEALEPEEAFERAVLKAAFGTQDASSARGFRKAPIFGSEEPIVIEPYTGTAGFKGSKDLIDAFDLYSMTGNGLGSVTYNLSPTVHARSFFTIDPLAGIHFDNYVDMNIDARLDATMEGTLTHRFDVPFPSKYTFFKAEAGDEDSPTYAKLLWKAGLFSESGGNVDASVSVSGQVSADASLKYVKPLKQDGQWDTDYNANWISNGLTVNKLAGELVFNVGFFAEVSTEFNNPLTGGKLGGGLRAEFAPKIMADAISLVNISDNLIDTYKKDDAYWKLDRDDLFRGHFYAFLDIYTKQFGFSYSIKKPTLTFLEWEAPGVPDINVFNCVYDPETPFWNKATYELQRVMLLPVKVGLAMFNEKEEPVSIYWRSDSYWNQFSNTTVNNTFTLDPLKGASTWYDIYPMVSYFGKPILYYKNYHCKMDPAYAELPTDIELWPDSRGEDWYIDTNIPDPLFTLNAKWVTAKWSHKEQKLTLTHEALPEGVDSRECTLHLNGRNSKGETLVEGDVPVRQVRIVVEFDPEVVEAEAAGGTYTVKIVKTPLKGLEVSPKDPFLHPTISGDIITVVVDPNDDPEERDGFVIVSGITEGGQKGEVSLKVHQKTNGEQFTVSPDPIEVPGYSSEFQGGELKRQLTVTYPKSAKALQLKSSNEAWLTVDNGGGVGSGTNTCNVTIKPNISLKDPRDAKITVELTKADGTTETKTVKVKQTAMAIDVQLVPSKVTLMAEESAGSEYSDKQTVTVKITPWDNVVASAIKTQNVTPAREWIKTILNTSNNTITVYGEANPVYEDRTNYATYTLTPVSGDPITRTLEVTQKALSAPAGPCEDYTPNPIVLPGNGGTTTVTFNCDNIVKIVNIFSKSQSWLEGISSGRTLTLFATNANTTGAMRQGTVELTFKLTDGTTVKHDYTVYQSVADAPSVPHVSPTELLYPAEGGTQSVQAYVGDKYNRVGYAVGNEGKGWVTVDNYSDYHLEIIVAPNTTGAKRTCVVTVYMASFEGNAPTPGTVTETFPVTITQEANELEAGEIAMENITYCLVMAKVMMNERGTGSTASHDYSEVFKSPKITFSQDGTTVHVQATNNYEAGYDKFQNAIAFDIVNFEGDFSNCKIQNLTLHQVYADTYVDWTQPGLYGKGYDVQVNVANMPWRGEASSYVDGAKSSFSFGGLVSEGVKFKNVTEQKVNYSEENPTQNFDLVADDSNQAVLIFDFTANGTAAARQQTPASQEPEKIIWNIK